jgi:hypothetical protein
MVLFILAARMTIVKQMSVVIVLLDDALSLQAPHDIKFDPLAQIADQVFILVV